MSGKYSFSTFAIVSIGADDVAGATLSVRTPAVG